MSAQPKDGHLLSRAYLDFCRSLPCFGCRAPAPSMAHHHPPKGMGGARVDDTKTFPVCAVCHQRCHAIPVVVDGKRLAPVGADSQDRARAATLRMFIERSTAEQFNKVTEDILEWKTRPGAEVSR